MSYGTLYLIPVPLGQSLAETVLPASVLHCAKHLKHFIAENAKSARAFLKSLPSATPLQQIEILELNEHTNVQRLPELLAPLLAGNDVGLISEAGCPAIADPGANLVALAQQADIRVVPLIGPSSILLALMGSGLSGQHFAFHGYLPVKDEDRRKKIQALEKDSRQEKRAQIFIETPYRNGSMLATLLAVCAPQTKLCIATDLTLSNQSIVTHSIAEWHRQALPDIDRRPTVFVLQAVS